MSVVLGMLPGAPLVKTCQPLLPGLVWLPNWAIIAMSDSAVQNGFNVKNTLTESFGNCYSNPMSLHPPPNVEPTFVGNNAGQYFPKVVTSRDKVCQQHVD